MQFNCPVCNKAGLPDFTANPIICPQCNSDLKPFLLLHSLKSPARPSANLFLLVATIIVACIFTVLYFVSVSDRKQIVSENSETILQFQDSINTLQAAITKVQIVKAPIKSSDTEFIIQYKVKKGDYTSKIAEIFYNDWRMYKKIETDNNLKQPYILNVGQLLTIKFNKE
jgi:nucleoid-associated protein YgaU